MVLARSASRALPQPALSFSEFSLEVYPRAVYVLIDSRQRSLPVWLALQPAGHPSRTGLAGCGDRSAPSQSVRSAKFMVSQPNGYG
jgi:hypothetical protein